MTDSEVISLPLMFVTADCDPKIKEIALQISVVGFFRKPVDGTALNQDILSVELYI